MASDLASALAAGKHALSEPEAKALLEGFGVATPRSAVAVSAAGLAAAASSLKPPYVVKLISPDGAHKSDIGGVRLNLDDAAAVEAAVQAMPVAAAYLVEEMAPSGVEMVVGGYRHARFGPVLMAGFGGILVEILDDIAFRVCPINRSDADAMLAGLKGTPLLAGYRGAAPVDREVLLDVMMALGGPDGLLMQHADTIAEFDVNPLIVSTSGAVAVDARARMEQAPVEASRDAPDISALLAPNAVAVAGASASNIAHGNLYIRQLKAFGFDRPIYPIHPSAETIEGLTAYPSLTALPEPVDYAYMAVGPKAAPGMLAAANGAAKFAQVMASGFDTVEARAGLAAAGKAGGARVLGPNCLGTYAPASGLSFMAGSSSRAGGVTVLAQSGGLSMDILRRGQRRGVAYRSLITMGDCADLGPADLLPWFLEDPETKVIGLYLEDAPGGRALFDVLAKAKGRKPVVLLIGGRTDAGARAASSHTGALASDWRVWDAVARQTGAALVDTLDGFIDALLACQMFTPRYGAPTRRVVLFGNGGGAGVLAADAFARSGLEIGALSESATSALAEIALPAGASAANPIDVPGNLLQREDGRFGVKVVEAALAGGGWDAFVMHMNVPGLLTYEHVDILGPLISAGLAAGRAGGGHVALVLRSDGEPKVEAKKQAYAEQALAAGAAVFNELPDAAKAIAAMAAIESA
jgi:acyl-CoA synthetase (NDP forming)